MKEYNRFTNKGERIERGQPNDLCDNDCIAIYNRLAELEDKIESGELAEFPRIIHPSETVWHVQFMYRSGIIGTKLCDSEEQAEARLKELENNND